MNRARIAGLLLVFLGALTGSADAGFIQGYIYDRIDPFVSQDLSFSAFTPIGETFTPTLSAINFAAFGFQEIVPQPQGGTYEVELFQGVGTGGTLLGTTDPSHFSASFGTEFLGAVAYFYFPHEIALTPGTPYSLIIQQISGDNYGIDASSTGQVGNAAILGGVVQQNFNLAFAEGIVPAPEPPSLVLMAVAGLVGLATRGYRRTAERASASLCSVRLDRTWAAIGARSSRRRGRGLHSPI